MGHEQRSRLELKLDGAIRQGIVRLLSGLNTFCVINEYPKSGGSWLAQMLAELLGIDFPRNRIPHLRSSVMQGHYLNPRGIRNPVIVWRDGRDVMVSWYYQCLFRNERENGFLVDVVRSDLSFENPHNIRRNLPAFIEYSFERQRYPPFSWSDFVRIWEGRREAHHVRYEDLHRDGAGELSRLIAAISGRTLEPSRVAQVLEEYSFARQSGRAAGDEDRKSFLRKGIVGDWRNQFSAEARETFDRAAGDELIRLGYESDRRWVSEAGSSITPKATAAEVHDLE